MDKNYFDSKESRERAEYLLGEYGWTDLLNKNTDSLTLDSFIDGGTDEYNEYNWDDGFELPYLILQHKNCELATALKIFHLGDMGTMSMEDGELCGEDEEDDEQAIFLKYLYRRIVAGEFKTGKVGFTLLWYMGAHATDALREKELGEMRAEGWPEVFLTDILA
ncbi:MAG: DUF4274 domain-containing protein [Deferribacteraceae bacterium]|nr:DUF4274 domain-containing protein [Deferribacteraceae bacterium]